MICAGRLREHKGHHCHQELIAFVQWLLWERKGL